MNKPYQRFFDDLDSRIDLFCSTYAVVFTKLVNALGFFLVIVVYMLTLFVAVTSYTIIIPYEQTYKSPIMLGILSCFGMYLLISIVFHYGKARTLRPVQGSAKSGGRWCDKCSIFKGDSTHHCSVCKACILGMDHHCIWINQCVGSHNHRHFFLFIVYLTTAMLLIVMCGFNTAYDHVFIDSTSSNFCSSPLALAPFQAFICSFDGLAHTAVLFCYAISLLLFVLVGALTLWNCFLISMGYTYIDFLKSKDSLLKAFKPNAYHRLLSNWRTFLGLRRNRTFVRHVLLPSTHPPLVHIGGHASEYDFFDVV